MANYGADIECLTDIADDFRLVTGARLLAQHAFHRITTVNLVDEANWGIDVTDLVGRATTQTDLNNVAFAIAEAVQRDDRVERVTADLSFVDVPGGDRDVTLTVTGFGVDTNEPFQFVIDSIADLTVEIMRGGEEV